MPQSLVLHLVAQSLISQQFLQGFAPQQLFFDLVDEVDPALGNVLRRDQQNRAYSLSALQVATYAQPSQPLAHTRQQNRPVVSPGNLRLFAAKKHNSALQFFHSQAIAPHTRCWWRITFLDDELFDHLIFLWNHLSGERFQIGDGAVTVANVVANMSQAPVPIANLPGTDWADSCSYQNLYSNASTHEKDIHIQFVTPTTFKEGTSLSPMPTASTVFHSLRKCWNRYSGLAFAPSLIKNIVPLKFDIKTQEFKLARAMGLLPGLVTGCIGQVSFRILESDPLTTKHINTLADFSRYCGLGYGTPVGMGTVRRLNRTSERSYRAKAQSKVQSKVRSKA
ncbi:MAG: CRISPR system precrRNA processing endoribonuclease RAMP protein Cas6 [Cyanobacteria bacterium P01_D01_bin.105]